MFYCVLLIIIYLLTPSSLQANNIKFTDWKGDYSGQTVFNFLTIPVSANQLSRNMTAFPLSMDATDVSLTSSGTAFFDTYHFALTHIEWLLGLRKQYLGACFPILDRGTFGFYSQVFSLGNFKYARDIDEYKSDPKAAELAFGMSYARQLIYQKLSFGIVSSYIESRLAGDGARAFNCSFDIMYRPAQWFNTVIYSRNIGNDVKYNETPEKQPFQAGLSFLFVPFSRMDSLNPKRFDLSLAMGVQKTIDAPLQFGSTIELKPIKPLSIRTGYEHSLGHSFDIGGLSAGLGFDVKQYGIDVGWKFQSLDFGSVWAVTIRYMTEDVALKNALDCYNVAVRYYKKGKYKPCIQYAKKAIKINPEMWEAHELINKTLSTINRKAGNEIVLIYTGNTQGQFLPADINGISMGGLARQAAVINQVKKEYQSSLVLDVGNNITKQTPLIKAQFSNRYLELLNYDAVCLGKGEIEFGFKKYCKEVNTSSLQLLCMNCPKKKCNNIIASKIVEVGKYKINIISVIPSPDLQTKNNDSIIEATAVEIVRYAQSPKSQVCNFRILVINDSWENVRKYTPITQLIDLILCGSLKHPIETPMKINSIPVFSIGSQGKYVGVIDLSFNDKKKFQSYNSKLIPLTKEVTPDPNIEYLISQISLKSTIGENTIEQVFAGNSRIEGVFAFISDRRGTPHAYLKIMKSKLEYPLTHGSVTCLQPLISFQNGLVIYLAKHDTHKKTALMTMDIKGENSKEIECGGSVTQARFLPDESWLYVTVFHGSNNHSDIYRIQPQGGELYPVVTFNDGSESDVSFSHDGKLMVFISDRDESKQLYISNIFGRAPVRLTNDDVDYEKPLFSPNDKYISYLSEKDNINNKKDLWVYERETGKKIRITEDAGVKDYLWLDDEGELLYSSGINLVDFNVINIKTKENKKFIVGDHSKKYSETNPRIIIYRNIKRIVYVREYENGERKIFMVNLDGTMDRQVTLDNGNCWF